MLLTAIFVVASCYFVDGFESETEMIKKADKLFEQKQYAQALDYYSQLVSLHAQDPNYNFKYGTCLLYASSDKEEALKFLKFAVSKTGVEEMAFYYVARAYHLNYYFKEAIKAYKDFRIKAKSKTVQENDVSLFITQCEEGKVLIQDIQSINVLSKKDINRQEFFRGYQLNEFDRKILVKPDEFKTKLDKKNKEYSLIVHNPLLSEVYFSSYGEKGENGKDLYKMVHFADGTWSTPLTLGPLINTALDEDYPYLHPSGKFLYFASKGHNSIGGYDIFKSDLDEVTNLWKAPVNVGFAVNSPDDDILYITDMTEDVAFFASSRASSKDEITVYKIVPNKLHQDNTIVKGEISIETAKQKIAQITVTDMETGVIVGVYKVNEKTGAYAMTLPSGKQYGFKVIASGYEPLEDVVNIPEKKEAPVINQKIDLHKNPQEKMLIANQKQSAIDDVAFNQFYKKSADLQVNSDKDVNFNSKPIPVQTVIEPLAKHDSVSEKVGEVKTEVSNSDLVQEAFKDAQELEKEFIVLQSDAEAAEYVAKVKAEEALVEKQELVDLAKKLNQSAAGDKEKVQLEIDQKGKLLRKKAREASVTAHYADAKRQEAKNKKEEYTVANQYAEVIKEASDAKNTDDAIAKLEQQKIKLDQIQERNKTAGATSIEEAYTATKLTRAAEEKKTSAAIDQLTAEIVKVDEEQKNLQKQLDATKNKQLKEEFKLQIDELKEELARKQGEKSIADAELAAIKSDTEEPSSDTQVIQNLQQEVNIVKTQDIAQLTEAKKKKTAEADSAKLVEIKKKDELAVRSVEPIKKVDQLKTSETKQKSNDVALADSTKKAEKELLLQTKEAKQKEIVKADSIKKAEKTLALKTKESKQKENAVADSTKKSPRTDVAVKAAPTKKGIERYNEEMAQAKIAYDKYAKIKEEQVYLKQAFENQADTSVKKEIKKILNTQKLDEEQLKLEIAQHVDQARIIQKEDKISTEQLAVNPNKINEKDLQAIEAFGKKGSEKEEAVTKGKGKQNKQTNTDTTALAKVDPILGNTALQRSSNLKVDFVPEKATEEELSLAAFNAFGIKTDPSFVYGSDFVVLANIKNARAAENVALQLYIDAKSKRDAADATVNKGDKKKLAKASLDLDEESQLKQLQASENYFYANRAEYDNNNALLKQAVSQKKLEVKAKELTDIGNTWISTLLSREKAKQTKDFREKVTYINDAYKRELELLKTQQVLLLQVKDLAVLKAEMGAKNKGGYAVVNKSKGDSVIVKNSATTAVLPTEPKSAAQLQQYKLNTLSEAYGVNKNSNYHFSEDIAVQTVVKEIAQLEDSAVVKYEQAMALESKAETAKKSEAKKFRKQALKLKRLGRMKQREALVKTGELHEKENEVNKNKIKQAFIKKKLTIDEAQKAEIKEAEDQFIEAKKIREKAKKTKSVITQTSMYNDAYDLETSALEKQNTILNADAEKAKAAEILAATERQKIADQQKVAEAKAIAAAKLSPMDSAGQRKAADLLAQADVEKNPAKKKILLEQSLAYTIASDKVKNEALSKELSTEQANFDANAKMVEGYKNEKLDPQQLALIKTLQNEADALMKKSAVAKAEASNATDAVLAHNATLRAVDLEKKAIEHQEKMMDVKANPSKYFKVKAVADTAVVAVNAKTKGAKKDESTVVIAENRAAADSSNTAKTKVVDPKSTNPVVVNAKKTMDSLALVKQKSIDPKTVAVAKNKASDKTNGASAATNDAASQNKVIAAVKPDIALQQYNVMLEEAKKAEKEIAKEVENYTQLKKESKGYQLQSENVLSQADSKTNEADVQKLLAESTQLKKLADQKEDKALQSSQLIDNARMEAQSKRREAQLYMESLAPQVAQEVKKKAVDDNKKTDVFAEYKEKTQKEVLSTKAAVNGLVKNDAVGPHSAIKGDDKSIVKVDVDKAQIFGTSATALQDATVKDQFEIKTNVVYSANNPIPIDNKMPEGLVYTVQVGAFKNPIPQDLFKGISPLFGEQTKLGFVRYSAGIFRSFKAAAIARDKIRQMGYVDAFVVPFYNGQRVSVEQANQITAKAPQIEQKALQAIEAKEVDAISKVEVKVGAVLAQNTIGNGATSAEVKTNEDVFYTVQICVISKEVQKGSAFDLQPLNFEKTSNGLFRYSTGKYKTFGDATVRKGEVNNAGIKDAFITAYKNGQRISASDAQNISGANVSEGKVIASTPVANIVFKVQVGAYRNEVPVETTTLFLKLPTKVDYVKDADGVTVFTVGAYSSLEEARKMKEQAFAVGLTDAFLVVYNGNEKISMDKALQLIKK